MRRMRSKRNYNLWISYTKALLWASNIFPQHHHQVLGKCVNVFRKFYKGLSSMKKIHLFYLIQTAHWTTIERPSLFGFQVVRPKRRSNTEYAKPGHNVELDGHNCSLAAHYTGLYANYAHMGFKFRYLNFKPMWDLIFEANLSPRGLNFRNLSPREWAEIPINIAFFSVLFLMTNIGSFAA